MIRFLVIYTCICAIIVGCTLTRHEAEAVKHGAGVAGTFLGLPAPVGEGIAALLIGAVFHTTGHVHGRRSERRKTQQKAKPS